MPTATRLNPNTATCRTKDAINKSKVNIASTLITVDDQTCFRRRTYEPRSSSGQQCATRATLSANEQMESFRLRRGARWAHLKSATQYTDLKSSRISVFVCYNARVHITEKKMLPHKRRKRTNKQPNRQEEKTGDVKRKSLVVQVNPIYMDCLPCLWIYTECLLSLWRFRIQRVTRGRSFNRFDARILTEA